ncbi:acetyl-CoA carboxylase biotin carboxylase subunit [Proteobacteria bacterium 005FR1]|nr:acetyl-CoA carboxylase biotin carboxylase subunit [Proteobacteria bacterium 005FR1]
MNNESATPFDKILIANRGEIALRIMRSARAMGYRTVAVYSTADRHSRHVREADQAVCIGEALPAQSYLCIDKIIEAARLSGADAIHPGYGFLAENAKLAQACMEAGIVFIGPSAQSIEAMGHKAGAKRLMMEAGVPCVPGYQGEDQSEARMLQEADRIGFPIMIKATAGGGGRGMRLVQDGEHFVEALRSAQSEAQSAFGDSEVILERAIVEPRHIEIQIIADRYGNAIHLGERDCSIQRRHQKLVEEAPSPAVSPELRAEMGATAVKAVQGINYQGAGTLEFLLDRDGNYYFMEMNTRLQVEHPVTEAITGLDLVELQLRIAAGEKLSLTQEDVQFEGHAIEVRLCAESQAKSFMPQSGTMAAWQMPATVRVEDAIESGAEVPPFYDSMIAKLISSGSTREEARRSLASALEDAVALGVETNQHFLARCLRHPVFIKGDATTGFVEEHGEALLQADDSTEVRARALAVVLLYLTPGNSANRNGMAHRLPTIFRFAMGEKNYAANVLRRDQGCFDVSIDGEQPVTIGVLDSRNDFVRFTCEGLDETAIVYRDRETLRFRYRGQAWNIEDHTHAPATRGEEVGGDGKIRASMNGRVVAVHVNVGDQVEAGQAILVLEAMKMEHVHVTKVAGTVTALSVSEGDQVPAAKIVAEIESARVENDQQETSR